MTDARWASRKAVLAAAAFVVGVTFFAFGYLDAPQWSSFTTWVLGLYFAANVSDQAVTK